MHASVRNVLENLLSARNVPASLAAKKHVAECTVCASELDIMRTQAELLKTLQAPTLLEPSGGFYARVLQRIEQSARRSIWWVFVYSPIGKRLAYASLALSIALGSYVLAAEKMDGHLNTQKPFPSVHFATRHYDAIVTGNADQQRDAVLANFVSHPTDAAATPMAIRAVQQSSTSE